MATVSSHSASGPGGRRLAPAPASQPGEPPAQQASRKATLWRGHSWAEPILKRASGPPFCLAWPPGWLGQISSSDDVTRPARPPSQGVAGAAWPPGRLAGRPPGRQLPGEPAAAAKWVRDSVARNLGSAGGRMDGRALRNIGGGTGHARPGRRSGAVMYCVCVCVCAAGAGARRRFNWRTAKRIADRQAKLNRIKLTSRRDASAPRKVARLVTWAGRQRATAIA